MKKLFILLVFVCFCTASPAVQTHPLRYYFKTLDIRDGLSQNTVNVILQDRQGFLWFGTKDGLNRFDGLLFRVFQKENSGLGNNFITVLREDRQGNIWVGTDAGLYVYDPLYERFTAFDRKPAGGGETIIRTVSGIEQDAKNRIWISVDHQGLFCYDPAKDEFRHVLRNDGSRPCIGNINRFWFDGKVCWLCFYDDNLYCTADNFRTFIPFTDAGGDEPFKGDVINAQLMGPHNCRYIGTSSGLMMINQTTRKVTRLLNCYVRSLCFKSDKELWVGTESGLYIYEPGKGTVAHFTASNDNDPYSLADNALYSICRDSEGGMWIGSYFGGLNYYPRQWSYFEKYYPKEGMKDFGLRVREFCPGHDGTIWIGTEDKGLFHFYPASGRIEKFDHPSIHPNVHALCLDGNDLWVGTFSEGLNRIDLRTRQVKHYRKGDENHSLDANYIFAICKTTPGDLWIGTTAGLLRYNRETDDFTRIEELSGIFIYDIKEDSGGNLWLATYSNGVYRYDVKRREWKNFISHKEDSSSLPYDKVTGIYEDSHKRLWFMTQGGGFCRFDPQNEKFVCYGTKQGFPDNIVYTMVEDDRGDLWLTTNSGLVRFSPDTNEKQIFTTANGLLSNQFNYRSGYKDNQGKLYFGSINGFISFDPSTFVENTFSPPVVITDFFLFNKRVPVCTEGSPLEKSIVFSDELELASDQNSFSLHVAALGYQAPEMNQLSYKLEGFDKEWYSVGRNSLINYSNLPYGTYTFRLRGSNSDGRWSDSERTLRIHIRPPFYLSLWAYAFYLLLGLCSVVAAFRYYRRRNEEQHRLAMEKFEREKERELYTAKIDFFTNVAHEIRTPLTLIKSPLENVLASSGVSAAIRDDLEIMNLNTDRLLHLVNQLLDFRKTETRGFRLNFVECDVAELLNKTYTRFTPLARQRGLDFSMEVSGHILASVDREALTKTVSNLFTNAVKHATSYIRVSARMEDERLVLTVCNDGNIIPLQMREEIFKPFIQYTDGNAHSVPGTGIGLALARSLAELHGGTLSMDDDLTCNRFVLMLPVKHEDTFLEQRDTEALPAGNAEEEIPDDRIQASRNTVLVVEDNVEMQSFVAKQLAGAYRVLTASDGEEALKVLEEHVVSLVVSDIMMPRMDGMELCNRLKSDLNYSHIPLVLLTAKTTLQSKIDGLKSGADAYVEKPFSVEYLKVVIANLLANREKLRAAFAHSPFIQTHSVAATKADEDFLKALNKVIMANMNNSEFCLDDMASQLNMSRSSLNRKIKGLLDMTPNDYIRLERLKKAAQLLTEGDKVNEVCYTVGFNTPSYFAKCFQKQFGILPKDFCRKPAVPE